METLAEVARGGMPTLLPRAIEARLSADHRALLAHVRAGRPVYGWNTGVGALDSRRITRKGNRAHQRRLLRSHAAGVGPPASAQRVRAMILARANQLVAARGGVRPSVVRALLALLTRGVTPYVPERGSVGASDLAPLAHVGLVLVGEGQAWVEGELLAGRTALSRVGLRPLELEGRDALALMNGLAYSAGVAALALDDARRLIAAAEAAAALVMAVTGSPGAQLEPELLAARPHPGVATSAARMRRWLVGSTGEPPFREPLTTRCAHQVTGAARQALHYATGVVEAELNAASDNPILTEDGELTANASTFHGQVLGEALELLATSLTSLAVMSEQRIERLLDPGRNGGLPPFLAHPRVPASSGLMVTQYTAASLLAELRTRSAPASIQSIPTCAGTEDHVSMSALCARRAAWCVETVEQVVAIELIAAAQAADLAGGAPLPPELEELHATLRQRVPPLVEDRPLLDDVNAVVRWIRSGLRNRHQPG